MLSFIFCLEIPVYMHARVNVNTREALEIVIHFILSVCGTEMLRLRAFSQEPFFVIFLTQHHGYIKTFSLRFPSSRSVFLRSGLSAQWIMRSAAWLQISCAMLSAIIKRFLWVAGRNLSGGSNKRFMWRTVWRVYVWSASPWRKTCTICSLGTGGNVKQSVRQLE